MPAANSLMRDYFHLLRDHELVQLRPVLEAMIRRRTELARHSYQLYTLEFGDRRSLAESEFVRLFESALEHGLAGLIECAVEKFAGALIGLGELLVEHRVPLEEVAALLGLFEE
ncbi:MAG: hypothetical protein ACLQLO_12010, partial [Mycobacterium sp.]